MISMRPSCTTREYYLGVDGTHPNEQGRAVEAHDVSASILKALGK